MFSLQAFRSQVEALYVRHEVLFLLSGRPPCEAVPAGVVLSVRRARTYDPRLPSQNQATLWPMRQGKGLNGGGFGIWKCWLYVLVIGG